MIRSTGGLKAVLLLVWILAVGCIGAGRMGLQSETPPAPTQLQERQIIVAVDGLTPDLVQREVVRLTSRYDLELVGSFPLPSISLHCIVFEVEAREQLPDLLDALLRHEGVILAQRNDRFESRIGRIHDDPYARLQHGARRIGADRAHAITTGRGVSVAVVDSGVDPLHPDLRGRLRESRNFLRGDDESGGADLHGTAVAGVIGARADDGIGIFGVSPDAELIAAKACWQGDDASRPATCSSWSLARALDFVIRRGVRVINLSLVGRDDALVGLLVEEAIDRGIAVVAAADGLGEATGYPAAWPGVIGVLDADAAAKLDLDADAATSTKPITGPMFAAPGDEILTTAPDAAYRFVSGSSVAVAHVSGVLALVFELQPDWDAAEAIELIRRTRRIEEDGLERLGLAMPDICAAIAAMDAPARCDEDVGGP